MMEGYGGREGQTRIYPFRERAYDPWLLDFSGEADVK